MQRAGVIIWGWCATRGDVVGKACCLGRCGCGEEGSYVVQRGSGAKGAGVRGLQGNIYVAHTFTRGIAGRAHGRPNLKTLSHGAAKSATSGYAAV
eukprot:IDg17611t1